MTAPNTPLGSFLEGLTGGVEQGYQFRTDIQDRKRRAATEDERLQMERAQALREAVGFQLQQKVRQAQLDEYQRKSGAPIEVSPGATLHYPGGQQPDWTAPGAPGGPRNIDPNSPEGIKAWQQRWDYEVGHPKPVAGNEATRDKIKLGRASAISAIHQAEALLKEDPTANFYPVGAAFTEGMGGIPGIGGTLRGGAAAMGLKQLTPNQQKFQLLMQSLAHMSVGQLPGARQSIPLFNSFLNTYRPAAGSSQAARDQAAQMMSALGRHYQQLDAGQELTEEDLFPAPETNLPNVAPAAGPVLPAPTLGAPHRAVNPRKFFRP